MRCFWDYNNHKAAYPKWLFSVLKRKGHHGDYVVATGALGAAKMIVFNASRNEKVVAEAII